MIVLMCVAAIAGLYQIRALVIYGTVSLHSAQQSSVPRLLLSTLLVWGTTSTAGVVLCVVCCVYGVLCVLCVVRVVCIVCMSCLCIK